MKKEDLFDAVTEIDDRHIDHAARHSFRRSFAWKQLGALAACGVLLIGLARFAPSGVSDAAASAPAASAPAATAPEAAPPAAGPSDFTGRFDVYSPPVLPLFVSGEGTEALEREHILTFDYSAVDDYTGIHIAEAAIGDSYVLINPTDGDILAMVSYPSCGALNDPLPTITVDGAAVDTSLSFSEIISDFRTEADGMRWNIMPPQSVEPYAEVIEDHIAGESTAFESITLEEPVTVYTFTEASQSDMHAATLAYRYACDPAETTVLSYGFNGFSGNENGMQLHDFFVNEHTAPDTRFLIVLGEDISGGTLQGYQDGGCTPGEELDGLTARITRTESTLGEALEMVTQTNIARLDAIGQETFVPSETYAATVSSWYALHGPTGSDPVERYEEGRLDDLVDEVLSLARVRWQTAEIVIPSGESCTIKASYFCRGSFNRPSGESAADVYGYSLLTIADAAWPTTLRFVGTDPVDASGLITTTEGVLDSFKVADGLGIELAPTTGYHEFTLYDD